jgi:hypothetical protein
MLSAPQSLKSWAARNISFTVSGIRRKVAQMRGFLSEGHMVNESAHILVAQISPDNVSLTLAHGVVECYSGINTDDMVTETSNSAMSSLDIIGMMQLVPRSFVHWHLLLECSRIATPVRRIVEKISLCCFHIIISNDLQRLQRPYDGWTHTV